MPEHVIGSSSVLRHNRFEALDLFRGVAAIVVMLVHINDRYAGLFHPQSGYLAVDLFFLLSGLVIANAYDKRLKVGWPVAEFVKIRLIRLYPLYFLALIVAVLKLLIQLRVGASPPSLGGAAADIGFEFFMLPSPTTIGHKFDPTFPMNLPAWSLFLELVMNLAYAFAARWLTRRGLSWIVAVSGATLLCVILIHGSDEVGNLWRSWPLGIPRALFPFTLGILISRAQLDLPRLGNLWAAALATALFCVLVVSPGPARAYWDICLVFILFPMIVMLGITVEVKGWLARISLGAGAVSYALYVLHVPVIEMADAFLKRAFPALNSSVMSGSAVVALLILGCWFIDRYYDLPVRHWLIQHLTRRHPGGTGT